MRTSKLIALALICALFILPAALAEDATFALSLIHI